MDSKVIKRKQMPVKGGFLWVELWEYEIENDDEDSKGYFITVDGVEWCDCNAMHHAVILFELICEHANEKMRYVLIENDVRSTPCGN